MFYFLIVNYYSTGLIARFIESLPQNYGKIGKIVIVNNSPGDRTLQKLDDESIHILDAESNLGFGGGCNLGLSWIYDRDSQAIVWVINPDTQLQSENLENVLVAFKNNPELSIVGTLIYTPTLDLWFAGGRFIPQLGAIIVTDLLSSHPDEDCVPCDWVSGCSFLVNLSRFDRCPQFDSAYFLYYEDFDFCRRYCSQGHQIAITRQLAIIHHPSSIADRNIRDKLKHSTYSYLLTLERYSNPVALGVRFLRLIFYGIVLIPIKPQAAIGKLAGVLSYLRRIIWHHPIDF